MLDMKLERADSWQLPHQTLLLPPSVLLCQYMDAQP